MQSSQVQDPRDIVGFPRSPLPKLSREQRSKAKAYLAQPTSALDPVIGLRVALATGAKVPPEWISRTNLDVALSPEDAARNFGKLITSRTYIEALQIFEVLHRRSDQIPVLLLRALGKALVPAKKKRDTGNRAFLMANNSEPLLKLLASVIPLVSRDRKTSRENARTLLQLARLAIESDSGWESVAALLDFMRTFERHFGWAEFEREDNHLNYELMRSAATDAAASLLNSGRIRELETVWNKSDGVPAVRNEIVENVRQLYEHPNPRAPIVSRNWAAHVLGFSAENDLNTPNQQPTAIGDAGRERLALMLMSLWEARHDGPNAERAFLEGAELLANGFDLHLCGTLGEIVEFDPEVHETRSGLHAGTRGKLIRPWIEWRNHGDIRVLIRARLSEEAQ